jgi:hypothetical protein
MLSAKRVRVRSQTCSEGYTVHRPPTCIYDAHLVTLLSYDSSRATFLRKQLALFLDCRASLGICTRSRHLQRSKDDKNKLQSCICNRAPGLGQRIGWLAPVQHRRLDPTRHCFTSSTMCACGLAVDLTLLSFSRCWIRASPVQRLCRGFGLMISVTQV